MWSAIRCTSAWSNGGLAWKLPRRGRNEKNDPRDPNDASVSAKAEQNRGQRQLSGDAKHSRLVSKPLFSASNTSA